MKKQTTLLLLLSVISFSAFCHIPDNVNPEDKPEEVSSIEESLHSIDQLLNIEEEENSEEAAFSESTASIQKGEYVFVPDSWDISLDSLVNSWHIKYFVEKKEHEGYRESINPSDAVYVERLSKLNTIIEMPYNETIRSFIDMYVNRRRSALEYMLGLERVYFPMIEQALYENGLPDELKYMAVIESGLNPVAVSHAGATGLWQFMLGTGKDYKLEINSLVDERRDPIKATYAACQYLKNMYEVYGDWPLAIASYNCGPRNVNKAIVRANGKKDFWAIYPYLPKETRSYVPLFIAATYAMNYYAHHQLYPAQPKVPMVTDTVVVNQTIHFQQIADVLNVDMDELRALNPQYHKDIVPGQSKPRAIRLRSTKACEFIAKEDSIVNHRKDELLANRTYVGERMNQEKITHRFAKGESLHSVGNKYGVTAAQIKKWNGLRSNKVSVGKRLTIYVDNGGYTSGNTSSSNETAAVNTNKTKQSTSSKSKSKTPTYTTYKVKSGDSWSVIARKYGCSLHDLKKFNNATSNNLKIGQVIKIPRK